MKTTHKKLAGGLLAGFLIATIGAVFATAQTDEPTNGTTPQPPFRGRHEMNDYGPLASVLTDEQETELQDLAQNMRNENATPEEIMTAIQEKLDEYGVLDKRLDNEINQTEQRLAFLTRQKELRNKGYNWTEISAIIQDEFNTKNTTGFDLGMMHDQDFRRGSYRGPHEFMPRMELD